MERIFRGKTLSQDEHFDDGEWVEGYYTCFNGKEHRIYSGYAETDCGDYYHDWFNVRPETVGQYTGLTDKNGKKVFEGDIVKVLGKHIDVVVFYKGCFCMDRQLYNYEFTFQSSEQLEVIGNIHDNPELIEVK